MQAEGLLHYCVHTVGGQLWSRRFRLRYRLFSALGVVALLAGCSSGTKPPEKKAQPEATAPAKPEHAPDVFRAKFDTSKGPFVIEVHRAWAPWGADRFYELIQDKFYDGQYFFRVVKGFMVQWGISNSPALTAHWNNMSIPDDPVKQSNTRGMVTFATSGPNTRTAEVFINFGNNKRLDKSGFSPFGKVVEGMNVVDKLYAGYGDGPPQGEGVDQSKAEAQGSEYIATHFPKLDKIVTAELVR